MDIRDQIIEGMEDGWVEPYYLVTSLIKYMTTDELVDCIKINEIELPAINYDSENEDDN
jgi:hypothetical protein